jgi:gluconokinase
MGVAGAGKTVVGNALATSLGCQFLDADDFHPESNRAKMHAGTPLTDEDRQPWLERLNAELVARDQRQDPAVLACSALREKYRGTLRRGLPNLVFVHLKADPETITKRVGNRPGHFMPATLVKSQFDTLEAPDQEDAFSIDATQPIERSVAQIRAFIGADSEKA